MHDLMDFFEALYGGIDEPCFVELRAVPSGRQVFVPLVELLVSGALETFITECQQQHENAYYGVALRAQRGGTKDDCGLLTVLYADIDAPVAAAHAQLDAWPLPPTCLVHSGGGVHAYWRLKEPYDLRDLEQRAEAESYLRRLAEAFESGDPAAAECARVLRLPGSYNFKPEFHVPPEVHVIH